MARFIHCINITLISYKGFDDLNLINIMSKPKIIEVKMSAKNTSRFVQHFVEEVKTKE